MTWVGFESTIPASKRAKEVHALDRSATVTGKSCLRPTIISKNLHQEEENLEHSRSSRWFDWDSNQVSPACKSRVLPLHYPARFYNVTKAVVSILELVYFVTLMFTFQRQKIFSCNDGTKANVTFTSEMGSEPTNKWTDVANCCVNVHTRGAVYIQIHCYVNKSNRFHRQTKSNTDCHFFDSWSTQKRIPNGSRNN
jgi:hypothetical protein